MSIDDEIIDRMNRGMLFLLVPQAAGAPIRRVLFVEEWLWKELRPTEGDTEWDMRLARIRADLEMFVTEETITPKYLFLLFRAIEAVWEIRCVRDDPSIRVLGLFAKKDVFVTTNFVRRDALGGKWNSPEWRTVKRMARAMWRKLFHSYQPLSTTNVHEACSGATDEIFYKERR
jgi:hypothetical protein